VTPEQLYGLAADKRVEAAGLEGTAGRLRSIAATIRGSLADIPAMSRRVWEGPAADQLEDEAATRSAAVDAQADSMVQAAAELEARARVLRSDAARLDGEALGMGAAFP
jgi:uncharacterized protein YukE